MKLQNILSPQRTFINVEASSKKKALETIARLIGSADPEIGTDALYTALTARERLGSTGLGLGIAIPHCRLATCTKITGSLIKLREGLDFDALDSEPVDLIFALVVPEVATEEHLQTLAGLAKLFNEAGFRTSLRTAHDAAELFQRAIEYENGEIT